jgi:hypothetical protein
MPLNSNQIQYIIGNESIIDNMADLPALQPFAAQAVEFLDSVSKYLLKKEDGLGTILLAVLLKCCIVVGIMMISQTICQMLSGYETALPVLITKSGSFVLLGGFALYFNQKLYSSNP